MRVYIHRLIRILGPESWGRFRRAYAFAAFAALFETLSIAAVFPLMVVVLSGEATTANGPFAMSPALGFAALALLYVVGLGLRGASVLITARTNMQQGHGFAAKLFAQVLTQPISWHATTHSAALRTAILTDAQDLISNVTVPLGRLVAQLVLVGSVMVVLLVLRPVPTLVFGGALLATYAVIFRLLRAPLHRDAARQITLHATRHLLSTEALSAIREVRLSGLSDSFATGFTAASQNLAHASTRKALFTDLPKLVLEMVLFLALMLALLTLSAQNPAGVSAMVPQLALFGVAGIKLFPMGHLIFANLANLRAGLPLIDKFETLQGRLQEQPPAEPAPLLKQDLRLERVSYTYPGNTAPSVREVSLVARPGDRIAVTGPSGSGKSTLIDLIAGLATPDTGSVLVDSTRLTQAHHANWLKQLRFAPQTPVLFDQSIADNIAAGAVMDAQRLREVADLTDLRDLLNRPPAPIGERGSALSGGQRQRINLARALYQPVGLYIFDEPTNNLDHEQARAIMTQVFEATKDAVLIVVTHDPWLAEQCSQKIALTPPASTSQGFQFAIKLR